MSHPSDPSSSSAAAASRAEDTSTIRRDAKRNPPAGNLRSSAASSCFPSAAPFVSSDMKISSDGLSSLKVASLPVKVHPNVSDRLLSFSSVSVSPAVFTLCVAVLTSFCWYFSLFPYISSFFTKLVSSQRLVRFREVFHYYCLRPKGGADAARVLQVPILLSSALYLPAVFLLQYVMRNRPAFQLKTTCIIWNLLLSGLSLVGFIVMIVSQPGLFKHPVFPETGFAPGVRAVICIFTLSKGLEYGDTVLLALRKKPMIFLHLYHHVTVTLYCWHAQLVRVSVGHFFAFINLGIHAWMYLYYGLASVFPRHPILRSWRPLITISQILQMCVGLSLAIYALAQGLPPQEHVNVGIALAMYVSYAFLFMHFFFDSYIRRRSASLRTIRFSSCSTSVQVLVLIHLLAAAGLYILLTDNRRNTLLIEILSFSAATAAVLPLVVRAHLKQYGSGKHTQNTRYGSCITTYDHNTCAAGSVTCRSGTSHEFSSPATCCSNGMTATTAGLPAAASHICGSDNDNKNYSLGDDIDKISLRCGRRSSSNSGSDSEKAAFASSASNHGLSSCIHSCTHTIFSGTCCTSLSSATTTVATAAAPVAAAACVTSQEGKNSVLLGGDGSQRSHQSLLEQQLQQPLTKGNDSQCCESLTIKLKSKFLRGCMRAAEAAVPLAAVCFGIPSSLSSSSSSSSSAAGGGGEDWQVGHCSAAQRCAATKEKEEEGTELQPNSQTTNSHRIVISSSPPSPASSPSPPSPSPASPALLGKQQQQHQPQHTDDNSVKSNDNSNSSNDRFSSDSTRSTDICSLSTITSTTATITTTAATTADEGGGAAVAAAAAAVAKAKQEKQGGSPYSGAADRIGGNMINEEERETCKKSAAWMTFETCMPLETTCFSAMMMNSSNMTRRRTSSGSSASSSSCKENNTETVAASAAEKKEKSSSSSSLGAAAQAALQGCGQTVLAISNFLLAGALKKLLDLPEVAAAAVAATGGGKAAADVNRSSCVGTAATPHEGSNSTFAAAGGGAAAAAEQQQQQQRAQTVRQLQQQQIGNCENEEEGCQASCSSSSLLLLKPGEQQPGVAVGKRQETGKQQQQHQQQQQQQQKQRPQQVLHTDLFCEESNSTLCPSPEKLIAGDLCSVATAAAERTTAAATETGSPAVGQTTREEEEDEEATATAAAAATAESPEAEEVLETCRPYSSYFKTAGATAEKTQILNFSAAKEGKVDENDGKYVLQKEELLRAEVGGLAFRHLPQLRGDGAAAAAAQEAEKEKRPGVVMVEQQQQQQLLNSTAIKQQQQQQLESSKEGSVRDADNEGGRVGTPLLRSNSSSSSKSTSSKSSSTSSNEGKNMINSSQEIKKGGAQHTARELLLALTCAVLPALYGWLIHGNALLGLCVHGALRWLLELYTSRTLYRSTRGPSSCAASAAKTAAAAAAKYAAGAAAARTKEMAVKQH